MWPSSWRGAAGTEPLALDVAATRSTFLSCAGQTVHLGTRAGHGPSFTFGQAHGGSSKRSPGVSSTKRSAREAAANAALIWSAPSE